MPAEVESMMYNSEEGVPWHGLGTPVKGLVTAAEAMKAAGLDWFVSTLRIFNSSAVEIPGYKAVVRLSDSKVLSIVSDRYQPVQNRDAFRFFDSVVQGDGKALYETAGSLRGGRIIWILANLRNSIAVAGEEVAEYVTLVNSHDASSALQMFFTPIRIVCMNTLQQASSGASTKFYARHTESIARHTESIHDKASQAQWILGFADKWYGSFAEEARHLAAKMLPSPEIPKLLMAAFSQPESKRMEEVWKPTRDQMERVQELVYCGRGNDNPKIQGTAWQAYQGISQFVDYEKPVRGQGNGDRRLTSAWFGTGAQMKARAWDWLIKY